ncbi:HAD family hydrolase [Williamsia sterculiae]|uniref:Phosphoglycolate phosphatase n=1 Tax=Williamsia sterculiae TaxID=1344003 RepID=A0A1N7EK29_9NOCA|nr:HAD family hydrolase [Williamsia sterculiae]SIR88440.1 phosphoglycolate phosphatase [Williamsia sterculiae]
MASIDVVSHGVSAVALFDLDGTLLDTPRAIVEQMGAAVEDVIGRRPDPVHTRRLIGSPLERMAAALGGHDETADVTARIAAGYLNRYRETIVPAAPELLFPGVRDGLTRLREAGVVSAVVTSKKHHSAEIILESAGIREYFAAVVGADDVEYPKPHRASGDRALGALGRTRVGPADSVIGDTASDIGLGVALGARTIAVTYGVATVDELTAARPDALADHFDRVIDLLLLQTESEPAP